MNANQEMEKMLAHQASEWVTVLRGNASREQLAAFAEWVRTSPRHVRDFLTMMAIERELHHVDSERRFGLHELGTHDSSNVLHLGPALKSKPARRGWARAIAATVLLTAALLGWQLVASGRQSYSTQIGEQRAMELGDGSIVHLNTHSQVKVRLSASGRDIDLVSGEALFKVQRDPSRPFRVHVGSTIIEALGTEFNVYRKSRGTTVSVLDGVVRVASTRLAAGDEARLATDGTVKKRTSEDATRAVAWRQRRLVFDNDSLADMVDEFNRYNTQPQFHLAGVDVERYHYTGVFDADDPESLVQLLSAEPGLAVDRKDGMITIRVR